jgi:hypothetical protein
MEIRPIFGPLTQGEAKQFQYTYQGSSERAPASGL